LKYLMLLLIQRRKSSLSTIHQFPTPLTGEGEGEGYYFKLLNSFAIIIILLLLLIVGCVGKPPEDDVALIKDLLIEFEKGLNEKDIKILGSVINKKEKDLASRLITDFSAWGELRNIYIASKRFTIVGDSAKVELKLKMRAVEGESKSEEFEKPVNLFLNKKRGKWRIETYKIMTDDE
jgi:hypothetical protein